MFSAKPNDSFADISKTSSMEAGRQKNGKLWSNLKDICTLLRIPVPANHGNGKCKKSFSSMSSSKPANAFTQSVSHSKCFTSSIPVF